MSFLSLSYFSRFFLEFFWIRSIIHVGRIFCFDGIFGLFGRFLFHSPFFLFCQIFVTTMSKVIYFFGGM